MLFFSLAGDEDVVDIGTAEVEKSMKRWKVWEAFRKPNGILRNSNERGGDCRFRDVFGCYRYFLVCTHKVDSRKDCHAMKRRDTIMDVWKWIAIGDGDEIESTVVTTWSPVPWFRFFTM